MGFPSFSVGEVLTAADMNAVGLWRVTSCTVTSVGGTAATASNGVVTVGTNNTSVTVSNAFSADYDQYLILINHGTHSGVGDNMNFQFSGITTSVYQTAGSFVLYGTPTLNAFASAATTSWLCGFFGSSNTATSITVFNPNIAKQKGMIAQSAMSYNYSFNGQCTSTSTATGFVLSPTAGSISGQRIRVYGYRN